MHILETLESMCYEMKWLALYSVFLIVNGLYTHHLALNQM
jgi:hypothetical protein